MVGLTSVRKDRLRSRHHPFVPATRTPLSELAELSIRAAQRTDCKWDSKYCKGQP